MNQEDFFKKVIHVLEIQKIPYMITGSVGAMLYGVPRLTNDMDVVVEMNSALISCFLEAFPKAEFYYPTELFIQNQIKSAGQFNLIHVESGSKIDFIIRKNTPFAKTEFLHRRKVPFSEQFEAHSASPEDIILSKLNYYKLGESEKHLRDIEGILAISKKNLDFAYIQEWVNRLDLIRFWEKIKK
jgi:hypothetical protein